MAWQLIYTSASRGLVPGHSGFCTVARSADLCEALTERLEQISSYHYLVPESIEDRIRNPIISAYRVLDVRGSMYHALTRIQPSGLDFTSRTNHLAQHLLFAAEELVSLPSPAVLLRHWQGWLSRWEGGPKLLQELSPDSFKGLPGSSWPARTWLELTGDAGRAAGLLESEYEQGCHLLCDPGGEPQLLELFGETLQLLNPGGATSSLAWRHTFTNFLQAEDAPADFQWRGCRPSSPAGEQALRRSVDIVPIGKIRVPENSLARLAREGPAPAIAPPAPSPKATLALRREPGRRQPAPLAETDFSRKIFQAPPLYPIAASPFRKPSLKTLGAVAIALILLAGLLGIKHCLPARNQSAPPGQTNPPAHSPTTIVPVKTSVPGLGPPGPRVAPKAREGHPPPNKSP